MTGPLVNSIKHVHKFQLSILHARSRQTSFRIDLMRVNNWHTWTIRGWNLSSWTSFLFTRLQEWHTVRFLPISTNLSTRQVMVNSLRCAGPDSWVTVYSGRRHPFCTTNSWQTSAQTSYKQTKPGSYERSSWWKNKKTKHQFVVSLHLQGSHGVTFRLLRGAGGLHLWLRAVHGRRDKEH